MLRILTEASTVFRLIRGKSKWLLDPTLGCRVLFYCINHEWSRRVQLLRLVMLIEE